MKTQNEKTKICFFHQFTPPTTTFQARNSQWRPTPAARKAMALWQAVLEQYRPAEPLKGPVRLEVQFIFPGERVQTIRTAKPDLDNLLKGVLDICTRLGYWQDDAQVVSIYAMKMDSPMPGLFFAAEHTESAVWRGMEP